MFRGRNAISKKTIYTLKAVHRLQDNLRPTKELMI